MNRKSEPLELVIEINNKDVIVSESDLEFIVCGKEIPFEYSFEIIRLCPENIKLPSGIYPYEILLNKKSIMSGYFEWSPDDN